jgi:transcriptional regulator of arginine metabolism
VLAQFGRHATAAENIVVLQSELGTAPAIARALDRLEHPRVVGTLAGDDTVLVVTRNAADGRAVAADLAQAIG